ncbi:MAG TPA: TonB-dependent receptor [Gemmatimonadaceae bacterium]
MPSRFGLLLTPALILAALSGARGQSGAAAHAQAGVGEIRGRLTDSASAEAVTSGSITARRASDSAFAGGALPKADGSFIVDGLAAGRYTVRVRALGFAPLVRANVVISAEKPVVDLGALTLSRVAAKLEGQVVTAEREDATLAPDRNSYSTKNMTTASGGTAVDVLRNVPSVEVDGNNNVTLRGNANVVVQINGRSSPLKGDQLGNFLAQLPASTVKNVEVSTNPSAKNDPEGTAGIINIVLNQQAEMGLSGGLTAGTGTTQQANLSGNIGRQAGPLTLLLSASHYQDRRQLAGFSDRTNLAIPDPAFVESRSDGSMQPRWESMTFRSEYRLTEQNAISADAMLSGGRFARQNGAYYTNLDSARDVIGQFDQFNNQASTSLSQDYTLAFHRTAGGSTGMSTPVLSTELRYSRNRWSTDNDLFGALTGTSALSRERDASRDLMPAWNLQTDYTHTFGAGTKLESGFKGIARSNSDNFSAAYLDTTTGAYAVDASRASAFDYHERIGALYSVLSQQVNKLQAQAGLRLEEASTRLALPTIDQVYETRYASAFPSGIVSYNFTEMRQAKLSYSRRITRPNPGQLSPIEWRDDARHLYHGNPDLRPEYTDAVELGLQDAHSWGSVQLNPYLRRTANAVRYIQTVDSTGVTVGTFDNVAQTTTVGADLNVNYHTGALTLFGGGSAYRYTSDAANLGGNLSTRAFVWSARMNGTWKLSQVTDLQVFANYRAPFATEGGSQTAFVFMNLAVRRKLWGDQGSVTFRVADPFNLMSYGYRTQDARVVELTERHFGVRGLFITITRNFGQQLKLRSRQQEDTPATSGPPGP